jgi:pyruvate dehydrogenase E1 component
MDKILGANPLETSEWREALRSAVAFEGPDRAHFLLDGLMQEARRQGAKGPCSASTPYRNTIPVDQEPRHPGDRAIEHKIL